MKKIRVLIIEDSEEDCQLILYQLKKNKIPVESKRIETEIELISELDGSEWDVIISDYKLPRFNGLRALNILNEKKIDTPFILVSGTIGEEKAVEIMKSGAHDYILKDNLTRLPQAVNRELLEVENKRQLERSLRESEDIVRQAQKIEAIAKFSGTIGHDFNNLLNAILLNCEALQMDFPDNELINKYTEKILKSQKKAIHLTQQLLLFSKKQIHYLKHEIDINNVITSLKKNHPELFNGKIKYKMKLNSDALTIQANPIHIEHILINIVENAKDAMPDGGDLTIETDLVLIDNDNQLNIIPNQYVTIQISDTGYGMTPETKKRIFEPFFTTKEIGKGFGLSVVYSIIKQYNGYIFIESTLNQGSIFKIYLPFEKLDPENSESSSLIQGSIEPITGTLLIVDDYEDLLDLLSSFLTSKGFNVFSSQNGKEALEKYKDSFDKIDLLVTDVVMPEMGGLDLANLLRKTYPNLKILFTSGYAAEKFSKSNIINNKTTFLIEKPFSIHSFLQKVYEIMNKN